MSQISDRTNAERQQRFRDRQKIRKQLGTRSFGIHLERAAYAYVRRDLFSDQRSIEEFVNATWDGALITPMVLRAAVSPAKTTDPSMDAVVQEVVADFIASLAPHSAAARLFANAVQVNLDGL